jgi:hypothetical protein
LPKIFAARQYGSDTYADKILFACPNSLPDFVATHMVASLQSPGVDWRKEFQAHMAAG